MPDRNAQTASVFTTNYIDWLNYQPVNIAGMNTTVGEINTATAQVTVEKDAAAVSAAAAKASEDNAALSANLKGEWSAQTGAAAKPYSVLHNNIVWLLLNDISDVTTSEPSVTADWRATNGVFDFKSSAFTILNNCKCSIDASSGAVDAAFQSSYVVGTELVIHNESISTNLVRLTNTALTFAGTRGSLLPGDNLVLKAGNTARIIMKTATTGVFI